MNKVFISSVIQDFTDEREAAESAVKSLGLLPIMAEQFSAQPLSPRRACLQGVKKSDLFLAIIGNRYGNETDSGNSPCEEEFEEARQMGLPIFIFIKNCKRDKKQEDFKERITSYEKGYFVRYFDTTDNLFRQVTESLSQYSSTTDTSISTSQASSHIYQHIENLRLIVSFDPSITAIVVPSDQSEPYIPIMDLSKKEKKETFQQKALFGNAAFFSSSKGINIVEGREHLELRQLGSHNEPCTIVTFHPDGTLAWMSCIGIEQERDFNLFDYNVINEEKLQDELLAFYSYASWFYQSLSVDIRPIFNLYTSVALFNKAGKKLGKKPAFPPNSMCMGMGFKSQENPLLIPEKPQKIAFSKLLNYQIICQEFMHLIIRAYKAEDMYYES
jgi:hypothetical protein